eukprot:15325014-Ditylum_brightwellii.AAC.1
MQGLEGYRLQCLQNGMNGQLYFPKHVLDKISQKVLRAFTAKRRYNRNMAYTICDGPNHLGGYEFTPLYHMQGSSQIQN